MFRNAAITISILAATGLASGALAADPKRIGGSDVWGAYEIGSGKARTCFVHGVPQSKRGKYTRRGDVFLQVSHRPGENVRDEVSVTTGYTYRKGSSVDVDVDGKKFSMFTSGGNAWVRTPKDDHALVQAMIRGNRLVIRGRSTRNTLTIDTYSLVGFTAAYRAASKACNVNTS